MKFADLQQLPDAELVELALGGEGAAFNAIMKRYHQRLFRAARAIVREDSEAEDVLQEAYMRAYRGLLKFRGEASLAKWLTRITLTEALGAVRRRRPAEASTTLDEIDSQSEDRMILFPLVHAAGDPETSAARADVRRLLDQAIELPEAFRLVFVLRQVEQRGTKRRFYEWGISGTNWTRPVRDWSAPGRPLREEAYLIWWRERFPFTKAGPSQPPPTRPPSAVSCSPTSAFG